MRRLRLFFIALAAVLVVGGIGTLFVHGLVDDKAQAEQKQKTKHDNSEKSLVVRPGDLLPAAAQCESDKFIKNSLSPHRKWSDAVSTPFKASSKKAMLKEILTENCGNPTLLDMNIRGLSKLTINGWNVGNHNPWMGEFEHQAKHGLRTAFLTKKTGKSGFYVTESYQRYAGLTNTLLLQFDNNGVVTEQSQSNWHLRGIKAGELPRVALNKHQENLPLLELRYTEKGQGCVKAFGFNTGDKRFESVPCKTPVQHAPSSHTTNYTPPTHRKTTPPPSNHRKVTPVCASGTSRAGQPVNGMPCNTRRPPHKHHKTHNQPVCEEGGVFNSKTQLCSKGDHWKQAGDDHTRDAGKGKKPPVKANKKADKKAPEVDTTHKGGTRQDKGQTVTDKSTNKPGSETGVKAPGTDSGSSSDKSSGSSSSGGSSQGSGSGNSTSKGVPPVEKGANGPGGSNEGSLGIPH